MGGCMGDWVDGWMDGLGGRLGVCMTGWIGGPLMNG